MGARDFVTRFVSDLSRFRVDAAADDLDDVARSSERAEDGLGDLERAAADAGRKVEAAGRDVKAAGEDLERIGDSAKEGAKGLDVVADDAEDVARRINASLSSVGDAARKGLGEDLDEGAGRAKESLRDVADESGGTAREMAASFSGGADDIADAVQEAAANALAVLGPAGLAIGVAAAVGIGAWRARTEEQQAAVKDLTDRLLELRRGTTSVQEATQDYLSNIEGKQLRAFAGDAQALGIELATLVRAHAGDAEATREVVAARAAYLEAGREASESNRDLAEAGLGVIVSQDEVSRATRDLAETTSTAAREAGLHQEASAGLAEQLAAQEEATERLARSTEAVAAITEAATARVDEAFSEEADGVIASIAELSAALDEQTRSVTEYADNFQAAASRLTPEFLEAIQGLPDGGAAVLQDLRGKTDEEVRAIEDRFATNQAAVKFAQQISAGRPEALAAINSLLPGDQEATWRQEGKRLGDAFVNGINVSIGAGVRTVAAQADYVRRAAAGSLPEQTQLFRTRP